MSTTLCDILGPVLCPMMPYGTPARDAAAAGDAAKLQVKADSASRWLAANPGHPGAGDVRAALGRLQAALGTL